ncbi:hypothetical protein D3C81_2016850 [compost metagenome]
MICDLNVEGIAEGIERLYKKQDIRSQLIDNLKDKDYGNANELDKLYQLIG